MAIWPGNSARPSSRLPQFAPAVARHDEPAGNARSPAFTPPPPLPHLAEGSFFVGDDRTIRQIVDGEAVPVVYGGKQLTAYGNLTGKRLAALIGLRDKARRVLQSPRTRAGPKKPARRPAAN